MSITRRLLQSDQFRDIAILPVGSWGSPPFDSWHHIRSATSIHPRLYHTIRLIIESSMGTLGLLVTPRMLFKSCQFYRSLGRPISNCDRVCTQRQSLAWCQRPRKLPSRPAASADTFNILSMNSISSRAGRLPQALPQPDLMVRWVEWSSGRDPELYLKLSMC